MKTPAQKKADTEWKRRHDLKRAEVLLPSETLQALDERAQHDGLSRQRWLVKLIQRELGGDAALAEEGLAAVLHRIEGRLDALSPVTHPIDTATTPATVPASPEAPGDIRVNPMTRFIVEQRTAGMQWRDIADGLNARGLLNRRGNPWSGPSLGTYARRRGLA